MIRTERLVLRAYRLADAPALARLLGDFEVARWLARVPHPYTEDDAREFIRRIRGGGEMRFAIVRNDRLVGGVGLAERPRGGYELGYWIGRRFHRRGYADEAVRALLRYAFEKRGIHRVVVSALPDNKPSLALIAKLGFKPLGLRRFYVKPLRPWPAKIPHFELRAPPEAPIRPRPRRHTSGSGSLPPGTSRRPARRK